MLTVSTRRSLMAGLAFLATFRPARAAPPSIELWKNRGCACCSAWAAHLEGSGFIVTTHEVDDVDHVRVRAGVPMDLTGCHTAFLDGYVIEGHVPADAIRRLLAERPSVIGLAVPGMPVGSPGMEIPGMPPDPYDVIAFRADGSRSVFMAVRN